MVVLHVGKKIWRQWRVEGGPAVLGRALQHGQMLRGLGNPRYRLDPGRACSDQAGSFAPEIDAFVWPLAGVQPATGETFKPWDVGDVGGGKAADGGDEILRQQASAVFGGEAPAVRAFVVIGADDARVEEDVAPEIEAVGNVVEVSPDLRVRGIALAPAPLPLQVRAKRVAVGVALRVAARAGVAIPVPGSAHAAACFQDPHRKAEPVTQADKLVEAGKPRAHDHGIERSLAWGRVLALLHHACHWLRSGRRAAAVAVHGASPPAGSLNLCRGARLLCKGRVVERRLLQSSLAG